MDTSAKPFEIASNILGDHKYPYASIPPKDWLYIIERVYKRDLMEHVPHLFKKIADICCGDDRVIGCQVPRGLTEFVDGWGINTPVCHISVKERTTSSNMKEQGVLLLTHGRLNVWGYWAIDSIPTRTTQSPRRRATRSVIYSLTEDEILNLFRSDPAIPYQLLDKAWECVQSHSERLKNVVYDFTRFASQLSVIRYRVATNG